MQFLEYYKDKRVLVTGCHGFKGGWLCQWLNKLGADVYGFGMDLHTGGSFFPDTCREVRQSFIQDFSGIRDAASDWSPQVVFHLAAQSIVSEGIGHPLNTLNSNVIGTANVLESCRALTEKPRIVCVTSDKCYWPVSYPAYELSRLGGKDPYSCSKACSELICETWRACYGMDIRSCRAGNVIGGGDFSVNRLVPDYIRAIQKRSPMVVRNPNSSRPWQHVLDCLSGYLLAGATDRFPAAINFGPSSDSHCVSEVLELLSNYLPAPKIEPGNYDLALKESPALTLDISLAKSFGWYPVLDLKESVTFTANWYNAYLTGNGSLMEKSARQIDDYMDLAKERALAWATDSSTWLSDMTP